MIIVTIIKVETVVNIVIYLIISKVTKLETLISVVPEGEQFPGHGKLTADAVQKGEKEAIAS